MAHAVLDGRHLDVRRRGQDEAAEHYRRGEPDAVPDAHFAQLGHGHDRVVQRCLYPAEIVEGEVLQVGRGSHELQELGRLDARVCAEVRVADGEMDQVWEAVVRPRDCSRQDEMFERC